jgi:thioredoxin-dependent peroxiredoxin
LLPVGVIAPEIDAETNGGLRFKLSEQEGLCTVVYFFPKAFTPGCTRETAQFQDNYNELRLARAALVGVSTDDHSTQCAFAKSLHASFPMIGDKNGTICKAYDVRWPLLGVAKRVTYVIGRDRVILGVFRHELQMGRHKDDVLRMVDALYRAKHTP